MFPLAFAGGALLLALVVLLTFGLVWRWMSPLERALSLALIAIVSGLGAIAIGTAHAATAVAVAPTPIVIPWGDLVSQMVVVLTPTLLGLGALALTWFFSKLPAGIVTALKEAHADTLINRAINQGIAMVEGAAKGKTIDVTIANAIMQKAAELLLENAPWLVNQLGTRLGQVLAGKLADLDMLAADAHGGNLENPQLPAGPAVPATIGGKS